ncbi:MAG: DUF5684 domain-containing protein [Eubacteriales bacterium]|nr:DUF5684 domain-containing protein [Eubacteriales bacterium]
MYTGYGYTSTASTSNAGAAVALFGSTFLVIALVVMVIFIIANWRIYSKAGEPGWGCIIPFYSQYLLFKIAWGNGWLFLLLFVPVVNLFVALVGLYKLGAAFGYGAGFFLGMLFLSPIFTLILGFGSSEYQGPA